MQRFVSSVQTTLLQASVISLLVFLGASLEGCTRFDYESVFSKLPDVAAIKVVQPSGRNVPAIAAGAGTRPGGIPVPVAGTMLMPPAASFSSTEINAMTPLARMHFDPLQVGNSSSQYFYLYNYGQLGAEKIQITVDSPVYRVSSDCGAVLPAFNGNLCGVLLTFTPTQVVKAPAKLTVQYRDGRDNSSSIEIPIESRDPVAASVEIGQLKDSGDPLSFEKASVPAIQTLDPLPSGKKMSFSYYLRNTGEFAASNLEFSFAAQDTWAKSVYSIENDCSGMILGGTDNNLCKFTVTFAPLDFDIYPTQMTIAYKDGVSDSVKSIPLNLSFARVPSVPKLKYTWVKISDYNSLVQNTTPPDFASSAKNTIDPLASVAVDFGKAPFGSTNTMGIYFQNTGERAITDLKLSLVDGSSPVNFSYTTTCSGQIAGQVAGGSVGSATPSPGPSVAPSATPIPSPSGMPSPGPSSVPTSGAPSPVCFASLSFSPLSFDTLKAQFQITYTSFDGSAPSKPRQIKDVLTVSGTSMNWAFIRLALAPPGAKASLVPPTTQGSPSAFPLFISYSGDLLTAVQKQAGRTIQPAANIFQKFSLPVSNLTMTTPTKTVYPGPASGWGATTPVYAALSSPPQPNCTFKSADAAQPDLIVSSCPASGTVTGSCCVYVNFNPDFGTILASQVPPLRGEGDFLASASLTYSNGVGNGYLAGTGPILQHGYSYVKAAAFGLAATTVTAPSVVGNPAAPTPANQFPVTYAPSQLTVQITNPNASNVAGQRLKITWPTNPVFSNFQSTCGSQIPTAGCQLTMTFNPNAVASPYSGIQTFTDQVKLDYDFNDYLAVPQTLSLVATVKGSTLLPGKATASRASIDLGTVNTFLKASNPLLNQAVTMSLNSVGSADTVVRVVTTPQNPNISLTMSGSGCGLTQAQLFSGTPFTLSTAGGAIPSFCNFTFDYENKGDSNLTDSISFAFTTGSSTAAPWPTLITIPITANPTANARVVTTAAVTTAPYPAMYGRDGTVTATIPITVYGTNPVVGLAANVPGTLLNSGLTPVTACSQPLSARNAANTLSPTSCTLTVTKAVPGSGARQGLTDSISFAATSGATGIPSTLVNSLFSPPPVVSFSPSNYTFASQPSPLQLGQSQGQSIVVVNNSIDFSAAFSLPTVSGASSFLFNPSSGCCSGNSCTVNPSGSCAFGLTYAPVVPQPQVGAYSETTSLASSYIPYAGQASVPIGGTATGWAISKVTATAVGAINFGTVYVGQTVTQTITYTIAGRSTANWATGISYPSGIGLSHSQTCLAKPATGPTTCTVTLSYRPTSGSQTIPGGSVLSLSYNNFPDAGQGATAVNTTLQANLINGFGFNASPQPLAFGDLYPPQSVQRTLTINTVGAASTNPWFSSISGLPAGMSVVSNGCLTNKINGGSCSIIFAVDASAATSFNTSFNLVYLPNPDSSAATQNQAVSATATVRSWAGAGVVTAAAPVLKAMSSQYSSAQMNSGLYSDVKSITFSYPGPSGQSITTTNFPSLLFKASTSSFPGGSPFSIVPVGDVSLTPANNPRDCRSNTLDLGQTCSLPVKFVPTQTSAAAGIVSALTTNFDVAARGSSIPSGFTTSLVSSVTGTGASPAEVVAGGASVCILSELGTLSCWGDNSAGQLGAGSTGGPIYPDLSAGPISQSNPKNNQLIDFGSGARVRDVSVGHSHVCALLDISGSPGKTGAVACWGSNAYGQLGDGTQLSRSKPDVQSGALQAISFEGGKSAVSIAAGFDHSCAVMADRTVQCWGNNALGQLGLDSTVQSTIPKTVKSISNATKLSVGISVSCATSDLSGMSRVKCWGSDYYGQLGQITPNPNVPPALAGTNGLNYGSYAGDMAFLNWIVLGSGPSNSSPVTDVSVSSLSPRTCTLAGGKVLCFGAMQPNSGGGFNGLLGNVFSTALSYGSNSGEMAALQTVPFPANSPVSQLSVGGNHSCVVFGQGGNTNVGIGCWGLNDNLQLGRSGPNVGQNAGDFTVPSNLAPNLSFVPGFYPIGISSMDQGSCMLASDNSIWCWGQGFGAPTKIYDGDN